MQRRTFIKHSSVFAMAVYTTGKSGILSSNSQSQSPTTTDILGPFYRPGAPFRKNLNATDFTGNILRLNGKVFQADGKRPMRDCLIEVWQCMADGKYDNLSDDFKYRASQKTSSNGGYEFITTIPIPYPVDEKATAMRPAHIHMRISAEDQQDLVTQIYLRGDPYLASDPSTSSPLTASRILDVVKKDETQFDIRFDVTLQKEFLADAAVFTKLCGVYKMDDGSMMEFYKDGDLLFYRTNSQILGALEYKGNNTFAGGVNDTEAAFELLTEGGVKVKFHFLRRRQIRLTGNKIFAYVNHENHLTN
jgi:catechol 1,2-dioxygenase